MRNQHSSLKWESCGVLTQLLRDLRGYVCGRASFHAWRRGTLRTPNWARIDADGSFHLRAASWQLRDKLGPSATLL